MTDTADVMMRWLCELSRDNPDVSVVAACEAQAETEGWDPQQVLNGILAALFDADLHPRGHDGKFIEKLGIVKLLGKVRTLDGRNVDLNGRRGKVRSIESDPKTPGRPNIRIDVLGPDGKPAGSVIAKPDVLAQAPEKARLDKPQAPKKPNAPAGGPAQGKTSRQGEGEFSLLKRRQSEARGQARGMSDKQLAEADATPQGPLMQAAIKKEQARRARDAATQTRRRDDLTASINNAAADLSTDDPEARAAGLDAILAKLRFSIIDTDSVHDKLSPPEDGNRWTKERSQVHEQMWEELIANVQAAGIPQERDAFVLGGLPGAGKSFSLKPGQKADGFGVTAWETNAPIPDGGATHVSINPDIVKEMLIDRGLLPDGISGDLKPMEQVTFIHEESSYLAKLFSERLGDEGYNVVLDNTFDSEGGMLKRMTPLAREGYKFRGLFVDIPVDESKASARKRYIDKALTDQGGRFVPSSVQGNRQSTKGTLSKNRDAFDDMVGQDWFTDWMVVDNTGITNRTPLNTVTGQGTSDGSAADRYLPEADRRIRPPKVDVAAEPAAIPGAKNRLELDDAIRDFIGNQRGADTHRQVDEAYYAIPKERRKVMDPYMARGHINMNRHLQGRTDFITDTGGDPEYDVTPENVDQRIADLNTLFDEYASPVPTPYLFRGKNGINSRLAEMDWKVGDQIGDAGFGSWSGDGSAAEEFTRGLDKGPGHERGVMMRIVNAAGTKALPGEQREGEWILPPNTHYEVVNVRDNKFEGNDFRLVDLKIVPDTTPVPPPTTAPAAAPAAPVV